MLWVVGSRWSVVRCCFMLNDFEKVKGIGWKVKGERKKVKGERL